MKFGLLMNVIILYHYLQYKDIGISYPIYLLLLFCLLRKVLISNILSFWKAFFRRALSSSPGQNVWNIFSLETRCWKQKATDRFSSYHHLVAEEVDLDWFYWQPLSRHILNWKCRNKDAQWEPASSQWFYVFFTASLTLTFVLGIKSPHKTGSIQACWIWFH